VSGSTTGTWTAAASGYPASLAIANYAPNLTIIDLSINDGSGSVPAATVTANLSALVASAQASGDVILVMPNPVSATPSATFQPLYYPAIQSLANSLNVPLIDIYGRWGQTWQTNLMSNTFHPNNDGYWDIAEAVSSLLLQVAP
jgi:lysophospholipase L1-like esterase